MSPVRSFWCRLLETEATDDEAGKADPSGNQSPWHRRGHFASSKNRALCLSRQKRKATSRPTRRVVCCHLTQAPAKGRNHRERRLGRSSGNEPVRRVAAGSAPNRPASAAGPGAAVFRSCDPGRMCPLPASKTLRQPVEGASRLLKHRLTSLPNLGNDGINTHHGPSSRGFESSSGVTIRGVHTPRS